MGEEMTVRMGRDDLRSAFDLVSRGAEYQSTAWINVASGKV